MTQTHLAQLLAFYVGDQAYVIDVMRVVELVRNIPVVPLPEQPDWLEGNIYLRGQLLPVLSLPHLLGRDARGEQKEDRKQMMVGSGPVIVIRTGEHTMGLRVERLAEVIRPPLSSLVPTAAGAPYRSKYAMGQVMVRGQTYTLLDVRPLAAL